RFAALALVAVACAQVSPTSAASATPLKAPASARGHLLASGEIHLPAASAFGEPGFHEPITVNATLPAGIAPNSVRGLVVTLRDAGRPGQTCGSEHPLSGCATVDWSDATSRPRVPPGGVFNNSVVLSLATGPLTLFLRGLSMAEVVVDHWDRARPVAHRCRDALHRAR